MNKKLLQPTPHKIYAQIGTSRNRQTFNKNIATAEKSPIFTSHKSYKITLQNIAEQNFGGEKFFESLIEITEKTQIETFRF